MTHQGFVGISEGKPQKLSSPIRPGNVGSTQTISEVFTTTPVSFQRTLVMDENLIDSGPPDDRLQARSNYLNFW
jgi:hypothetical protein